ncbi:hypothetical protein Ahy_B02g057759 isoform A [Arachis hypogaea]|uniref:Uncharacterized protein n=1 Tax=Arachis hypogaea TaxID=3818 RepID=A0A445ACX5_ARAHY|nr:hypothetical protein Ahy_B02g057759 isoform A [Arachis hypogaea]
MQVMETSLRCLLLLLLLLENWNNRACSRIAQRASSFSSIKSTIKSSLRSSSFSNTATTTSPLHRSILTRVAPELRCAQSMLPLHSAVATARMTIRMDFMCSNALLFSFVLELKSGIQILNAQLVRRRLRHIAMRGTIIHRKYLYATVSLIPFSSALMVLPLPNIAFFWVSFRAYSHWRALQGSEKLFQLASDSSKMSNTSTHRKETEHNDSTNKTHNSSDEPHMKLRPLEELDDLVELEDGKDGLSEQAITKICKIYELNTKDVLKYEKSTF